MTWRKHYRLRKWGIGLGVVFVLFNILSFFILPAIIKSQMLKRLPALTHRHVAVGEVKLNPYALSFTLRGFSLTETNGDEFVSLDELYVNFESISLFKRGFVFSEIDVKKPSANILRLADGTFNFSNLLPPTNQPPAEAKPAIASSGRQQLPLVVINKLQVENGRFSFTDLDRKKPFQRQFGPINVTLTDFTTRPKTGSPYSVVVSTDDGETFAWSGDISIAPLYSAGSFKLTGLHVNKYAAYAEDVLPIQVVGGQVDVQTDYRVDVTGEEATASISNLTVDLSGVAVSTTQPRPARATLDKLHLSVSGVALDTAAKRLSVADIRLSDLTTGVTLLPGAPATQTVVQAISPPATEKKPTAEAGTNNAFQVTIGEVALDKASFHFTDESVQPHVESAVEDFNGSIKGLTSDMNTVATVDFSGKVNKYAPFSIKGKINPLTSDLFIDLAISLQNDALTPASPYAAKYVGFPLESGALSLDLRYYITQKELKAENHLRVDQLRLGDASNSPDAIKLPVKLGIALLQDRHGVIALNVPVNGRIDDPKFRLGPVIMQVFMNIITKAITKPFAMLGSMFGGGEDLDHINFEPGKADFAEGELAKLDSLTTALYERPQLKLVIAGSVDPVKDREALAKLKLEHHLSEMRMKELQATSQKVTSVDAVRMEPADRDRLIKLAYAEAMGLVSIRASASREDTVLAHLQTKTNFEPLHPAKSAERAGGGATGRVVSLKDMEAKLIEVTEVTPADFKKLMDDRAAAVQSYLLQSGKVEPARLTIAASKTVDASFQGSNRVNLTLQ
ncbi:MAG TPA: DUF748 domain-containing protein [Verrucomicrobiae bacterium]|nr:DUF748 domain-containing protein [Verrucomicrobiae bacterium]